MQITRGRWFWALVVASIFMLNAFLALALEKQSSGGHIAIVNGSVITQKDFDRELNLAQQQLIGMGKHLSDSQLSELNEKVLENIINRELLYQESQRKGIKVDEAALDKRLEAVKKQFASNDEFNNALIKANLSEADIRSQIKKGVAIDQFIMSSFGEKVTVSDEEMRAYYESHQESFKQPEQMQASHILIKVDPQADESQKAEARKKIEEIKQKLGKGADFAALAREFSQCPSSSKGGDLGYFRRGQMVKPFEEAAFALKPGEVSDIIETKFGYHLIKAIDKKPATTTAFAEIKSQLGSYLKHYKIQKEVSKYVEKLKEKAKVERFLKKGQQ
jgi:peptidyl-prolyl cis-trans isomerase C